MIIRIIILLIGVVYVVQAQMTFKRFQLEQNKTYQSDSETTLREKIFNQNLAEIEKHNKRYEQGFESYEQGVNQFTDLTQEEFASRFKPLELNSTLLTKAGTQDSSKLDADNLPQTIDWRDKGVVTGIKNQGICGSCWSFSTTGTLEGYLALKTGNLTSLSEQQLIDCSRKNNGCNAGSMIWALDYVIENGLTTESEYPYKGRQGSCESNGKTVAVELKTYKYISNNENAIKSAVGLIGPISVSVNGDAIQSYKNGIFSGPCSTTVNHGVLVVGYGTDSTYGDYWIIKNSWGKTWREQGYYRMVMGKGLCGINTLACYPTNSTNPDNNKPIPDNGTKSGNDRNIFIIVGVVIVCVGIGYCLCTEKKAMKFIVKVR